MKGNHIYIIATKIKKQSYKETKKTSIAYKKSRKQEMPRQVAEIRNREWSFRKREQAMISTNRKEGEK
jgi:hypothetical protein